jgi:hypothetical protein
MGFAEQLLEGMEERIASSQIQFSGTGVISAVSSDLLTAQVVVSGGSSSVPMMVAHHVMPVAGMRCGYIQFTVPKLTRAGKPNEGGSEFVIVAQLSNTSRPNQAWTKATLVNAWTNRAGAFPNMQFRIGPTSNRVEVAGEIVPGTLTDGTTIFTLPVGYRPPYEYLLIARDAANAVCYLQVNADGTVKIFDAAGSTLVQVMPQTFPLDGV